MTACRQLSVKGRASPPLSNVRSFTVLLKPATWTGQNDCYSAVIKPLLTKMLREASSAGLYPFAIRSLM